MYLQFTTGNNMKRVLILILAISTSAAARHKKTEARPGPYVFTTKSSAQTLKELIFESKRRLHARFRQSVPVSFLETSADPRHGCDFHGVKYV
jgi:hypothetical protein